MANFDANEIKRQAGRLTIQTENFVNSCNTIIKDLDVLRKLVKTEDSDLSGLLFTLQTDYEIVHGSVKKKFEQLATIMNNWAEQTLANQRALEEKIRKRNQDFESIQQMISVLNK